MMLKDANKFRHNDTNSARILLNGCRHQFRWTRIAWPNGHELVVIASSARFDEVYSAMSSIPVKIAGRFAVGVKVTTSSSAIEID